MTAVARRLAFSARRMCSVMAPRRGLVGAVLYDEYAIDTIDAAALSKGGPRVEYGGCEFRNT